MHKIPPKQWCISTRLRGVTVQKTVFFVYIIIVQFLESNKEEYVWRVSENQWRKFGPKRQE